MSTRADWTHLFARRQSARGGEELAAILAGTPPGVLPLTGGFPNPATFATDALGEIAARVLRDEPGLALQYTPVRGSPACASTSRGARRSCRAGGWTRPS